MKSKKFVFGVLLILTFYLISCAPQASDEEIFRDWEIYRTKN